MCAKRQGTYSDSLLLVQGVETQGLFNWLMTSKLNVSNTGPLAGVPPTLLAPVAFHGATLRPLRVNHTFIFFFVNTWCCVSSYHRAFLLLPSAFTFFILHHINKRLPKKFFFSWTYNLKPIFESIASITFND